MDRAHRVRRGHAAAASVVLRVSGVSFRPKHKSRQVAGRPVAFSIGSRRARPSARKEASTTPWPTCTCSPRAASAPRASTPASRRSRRRTSGCSSATAVAGGGRRVHDQQGVRGAGEGRAGARGRPGEAPGVVVNAGNANACTGRSGEKDARRMCELAAGVAGCDARRRSCRPRPASSATCCRWRRSSAASPTRASTSATRREHALLFADAILTTDTRRKAAATTFKRRPADRHARRRVQGQRDDRPAAWRCRRTARDDARLPDHRRPGRRAAAAQAACSRPPTRASTPSRRRPHEHERHRRPLASGAVRREGRRRRGGERSPTR